MCTSKSIAVVICVCCWCLPGISAQEPKSTSLAPRADIEPRADEALHRMSNYLGSAQAFSFKVTTMVDHMLDNGQKIQMSDRNQFMVRRPNRMTVILAGDSHDEQFWYDGKTLALLDRQAGEYGTMEVPDKIETMLDQLAVRYNLVVPLAELFFDDCYRAVIGDVVKGAYVGLHQVQGVKCHHLAFRQGLVDWQIWIEDGDKPLPRKIVITYREVVGQPQYIALLDDWNLSPSFKADTFDVKIPSDAKKIDLGSKLLERKTRR